MTPRTMLTWRTDEQSLAAGRRLHQNEDFKALLRTLEGFSLMQRGAPEGASDIDVARKLGEATGHSHILGFLYTMDTAFETRQSEVLEADFGANQRKK